jgi:hypothetical protein
VRFTIDNTLARAGELVGEFERRVGGVDPVERGIAISEALFVFATVADLKPRQIIESGRALGQSTYLLGRAFPDTPIVSIEANAGHPDAEPALERLRGLANVACLFGDSRVLLPQLTRPGDVVIIDGPKRFRALKLAYKVMRRRQPALVFVHDCERGTPFRRFVETRIPWSFFSDDHRFVQQYCRLDRYLDEAEIRRWSDPDHQPESESYAGTFGCIPGQPGFPGLGAILHVAVARLAANVSDSVSKRAVSPPASRRPAERPRRPDETASSDGGASS